MSEQTWTKEERAEHRKQWVAALRSGEYRQGQHCLRSPGGAHCCLGVATDLARKAGVAGAATSLAWGNLLADPVRSWLGLASMGGDLRTTRSTEFGVEQDALWKMNDLDSRVFAELADVIERGDVLLEGEEA